MKRRLLEHSKEYIIVNDALICAIIRFIEGDYAKRMSEEVVTKIS